MVTSEASQEALSVPESAPPLSSSSSSSSPPPTSSPLKQLKHTSVRPFPRLASISKRTRPFPRKLLVLVQEEIERLLLLPRSSGSGHVLLFSHLTNTSFYLDCFMVAYARHRLKIARKAKTMLVEPQAHGGLKMLQAGGKREEHMA
ncbi:hypothetical protein GUITHDRAFT_118472 [Guillardia theta CCMP2712]|uniref:Uncharacterized protein n=1 Tax=Guillardia theta (strain CCMP2712) TaxID=905079 RepID=L1IGK4_GUITC|nr:hypothetical protein GUITHDRAFT_118472 [Guillardia theta CCMP2712]EKX35348.1 hypothetical protein GUITHDRAFT_118472 [Guillardia theta CCMP2712]|eukprot:XP_005822328.1 hypothetical protein GUITHDRAFT_118472 [Guillardia theta CCMP2712]